MFVLQKNFEKLKSKMEKGNELWYNIKHHNKKNGET